MMVRFTHVVLGICVLFISHVVSHADGMSLQHQVSRFSSVAETVDVLKRHLVNKGITIFAIIDHAAEAKFHGMALRPTQVLIFGNPQGGTPLMQAYPSIAIDLPLKVLVWQDEHQGSVWVSYPKAGELKARYHIPEHDERARIFDMLPSLVSTVTNHKPIPPPGEDPQQNQMEDHNVPVFAP